MYKLTLKEMFLIVTLSAVCAGWWKSHTDDQATARSLAAAVNESRCELETTRWKVSSAEWRAADLRQTLARVELRINEGKQVRFAYFCYDNGRNDPTLIED